MEANKDQTLQITHHHRPAIWQEWLMRTSDESTIRVFEGKVLRKNYDLLRIGNGEYRSRWNDELYEIQDGISKLKDSSYAGDVMLSEWMKHNSSVSIRRSTRRRKQRKRKTSTPFE